MHPQSTLTRSHYEKIFEEELSRLDARHRRAVEKIDVPVTVSAGPLSENALEAMRIQEYRKYFLGGWER